MPLGRRSDRDGLPLERGAHEVRGIIGGGAVPRVPRSHAAFCVPCVETPMDTIIGGFVLWHVCFLFERDPLRRGRAWMTPPLI